MAKRNDNEHRQAILANQSLLALLGLSEPEQALGQRPGELVACVHAWENPAGCGTSPSCAVCGAVNAIMESQRTHGQAVAEFRLTVAQGDHTRTEWAALDFQVAASAITVNGEELTIFSLTDISAEKRRRALERIFFHDIMNTAGGVLGAIQLMGISDDPQREVPELIPLAEQAAEYLIEELQAQRALAAAENNELTVTLATAYSLLALERVVNRCRSHEAAVGRALAIAPQAQNIAFVTDPVLLERVLGNMIKNALEACQPGQTVTVGCQQDGADVLFWVHNPTVMPLNVQLQMFQRSFSTKGQGRGLGTYSMKLLSERYLKGRVAFTSREGEGTRFTVVYPRSIQ